MFETLSLYFCRPSDRPRRPPGQRTAPQRRVERKTGFWSSSQSKGPEKHGKVHKKLGNSQTKASHMLNHQNEQPCTPIKKCMKPHFSKTFHLLNPNKQSISSNRRAWYSGAKSKACASPAAARAAASACSPSDRRSWRRLSLRLTPAVGGFRVGVFCSLKKAQRFLFVVLKKCFGVLVASGIFFALVQEKCAVFEFFVLLFPICLSPE